MPPCTTADAECLNHFADVHGRSCCLLVKRLQHVWQMLLLYCQLYHGILLSCDLHAALLGLVNELIGGSLIAPSGQELQPTAAAIQWADATGSQDASSHAWASVGVAASQEVPCRPPCCKLMYAQAFVVLVTAYQVESWTAV